jgi:hypothetical protein
VLGSDEISLVLYTRLPHGFEALARFQLCGESGEVGCKPEAAGLALV